jgi:hypothetical protein
MLARAVSTVDRLADDMSATKGVSLTDLEPLTTLLVRTCHSLYRIIVWQDTTVLVQGGRHFPDVTVGRIEGSGFGGSLLKMAWIGVGLRMEICAGGRRIVTSPVRKIRTERKSRNDRIAAPVSCTQSWQE